MAEAFCWSVTPAAPKAVLAARDVADFLGGYAIDVRVLESRRPNSIIARATVVAEAPDGAVVSRRSSCSAVTARSCARPNSPATQTCRCSASTSDTSAFLPRLSRPTSPDAVRRIADRDYDVEERLTLDVEVTRRR